MRYLIYVLGIWLCCLLSYGAQEAESIYAFDDPIKAQWFEQLSQDLRCPKCQNQNIADSNATIALDLREKTYELLQLGYDKTEVINYMTTRYGQFITYDPVVDATTLFLWAFPISCLIIGSLAWFFSSRKAQEVTLSVAEKDKLAQFTKE